MTITSSTYVLTILEEENVFIPVCKRNHETFNFKCGLLEKVTIRAITVLVNEYDSLWKFGALCDEFTA